MDISPSASASSRSLDVSPAFEQSLAVPTKKISKKAYNKSRLLSLKSGSNLPQAKYKFIFDPARLLSPFNTHRMEGDLFLPRENIGNNRDSSSAIGSESGLLQNFNSCKQPMSAIHDKNLRLVVFKVESHETVITPIEMIVNRLDSLGDKHAHELAETVKYYGLSVEFMKNVQLAEELPAKNHAVFKDYQMKIKKLLLKYQDQAFVFTTRTKYSAAAKRFEVVELGFSEGFVRGVGHSIAKFIRKTLKKGFPDVVHIAGNYHEWYSQILQMNGLNCEGSKPRTCVFYAQNKTQAIECQVMVENVMLHMDNYIENTMVFICVPNYQKPKNERILGLMEEEPREVSMKDESLLSEGSLREKTKGPFKEKGRILIEGEASPIHEARSFMNEKKIDKKNIYNEEIREMNQSSNELSFESGREINGLSGELSNERNRYLEEKSISGSMKKEKNAKFQGIAQEFLKKFYPDALREEIKEI